VPVAMASFLYWSEEEISVAGLGARDHEDIGAGAAVGASAATLQLLLAGAPYSPPWATTRPYLIGRFLIWEFRGYEHVITVLSPPYTLAHGLDFPPLSLER
jgi:hypothetical protein